MSTAISGKLADSIKEEVGRLLGRGRTTFPCPLDSEELSNLWNSMIPLQIRTALDTLRAADHRTEYHYSSHANFNTRIVDKTFKIFLYGNTDGFIIEQQEFYRSTRQMAEAFPRPVEDWPVFLEWVNNTGVIERDFTQAIKTLEALLGMCNTVGQVTRAVPELVTYLTGEKREILQSQKRASNMPYEWSIFDRKRIDVLQFSLAKAHLMPKTHNRSWDELQNTSRALIIP